jgi:hypothetical protein
MTAIGTHQFFGYTVQLDTEARRRHIYCIGQTGVGKSTLLESMVLEDIANGHGVLFYQPARPISGKDSGQHSSLSDTGCPLHRVRSRTSVRPKHFTIHRPPQKISYRRAYRFQLPQHLAGQLGSEPGGRAAKQPLCSIRLRDIAIFEVRNDFKVCEMMPLFRVGKPLPTVLGVVHGPLAALGLHGTAMQQLFHWPLPASRPLKKVTLR